MKIALPALLAGLALVGCSPPSPPPPAKPGPVVDAPPPPLPAAPAAPAAPVAPVADYPLVDPIEPGRPGGLPDDRTPISEAPFTPQSEQGAADVVQVYFAMIGEDMYGEAWRLWADGGKASGQSQAAFAAMLGQYIQYDAQVGAPGRIEGAAGTLHIAVPVQIYGRLKSGAPFHQRGDVLLSRVNDVPGSTPEQRLWRIRAVEVG